MGKLVLFFCAGLLCSGLNAFAEKLLKLDQGNVVKEVYYFKNGLLLARLENFAAQPDSPSRDAWVWGSDVLLHQIDYSQETGDSLEFFDPRARDTKGLILFKQDKAILTDAFSHRTDLRKGSLEDMKALEYRILTNQTRIIEIPNYLISEHLFLPPDQSGAVYLQFLNFKNDLYLHAYLGTTDNNTFQWIHREIVPLRGIPTERWATMAEKTVQILWGAHVKNKNGSANPVISSQIQRRTINKETVMSQVHTLNLSKYRASLPSDRRVRPLKTPIDFFYPCESLLSVN